MTRYGMAVDMKRCMGCNMCANSCRVEHNLPNGILYNRAETEGGDIFRVPSGTYPNNLSLKFYTMSCMHCDNPACLAVCPTGATYKRETDGLVLIDPKTCIGCGSCIAACPYDGVRTMLPSTLNYPLDFALGDWMVPAHVENTVEKCTFCVERLDRGELPLCVELCPPGARYFGDLDDPSSEISKVLAARQYDQMKVAEGTKPNMYYLK